MQEYELQTDQIKALLGSNAFAAWKELTAWLDENYSMEKIWGKGGKKWDWELKYRKGGKTLCSFYPAQGFFGFMVIFGKAEREKVEAKRELLSDEALKFYDDARVYHDGKWVMLELNDSSLVDDAMRMTLIKRKPNRK